VSYVLKLANVIVGKCDLPDDGARIRRAPFRAGLGWELVEPIFQLQRRTDAESVAKYRKARDTLALALYAPDGSLVETSRIDIDDDASSPTGLTLEIHVVQRGA
jgi:hypothetical protein